MQKTYRCVRQKMLFDIEYPITCHNKLMWNSANDKPFLRVILHNKPLLGIIYNLALPHYPKQ